MRNQPTLGTAPYFTLRTLLCFHGSTDKWWDTIRAREFPRIFLLQLGTPAHCDPGRHPLPPARAALLPPEELRRRQLAALIAWFVAGARTQPAVLPFEDLHWADPTSLNLMQALAERSRTAPLFIIATARPEFRPPWSLRSHHSVISLSPLDRADVAQMVGELAARHALARKWLRA